MLSFDLYFRLYFKQGYDLSHFLQNAVNIKTIKKLEYYIPLIKADLR